MWEYHPTPSTTTTVLIPIEKILSGQEVWQINVVVFFKYINIICIYMVRVVHQLERIQIATVYSIVAYT